MAENAAGEHHGLLSTVETREKDRILIISRGTAANMTAFSKKKNILDRCNV